MKRNFAIIILLLIISSSSAVAMAMSYTLHFERNYLDRQYQLSTPHAPVNLDDYLSDSKPRNGKSYLESKGDRTNFTVGKLSYTLGNGLIAGISDTCGIRTSFENNSGRASFFYGNDGQRMIAGDVKTTPQRNRKLTLEASFFKIDTPFAGVTVSSNINKKESFNIQTSENLNTQAKGYLIQIEYGQAQRRGDVYASLSYRYVQPGAVSDYSANADFDDSKGIRIETTYMLNDNLALSILQDFATTQDNFAINRTNATLTWDY